MDLDDYAGQQNQELYRKLLAELPGRDTRRTLLVKLLGEEKAKEAARARIRSSKKNRFRTGRVRSRWGAPTPRPASCCDRAAKPPIWRP